MNMAGFGTLKTIDDLVAPIPGADPRGADLWRAEIKDKFDEARKEVARFDKGATAHTRPIIETPGNWELIVRESQAYLTDKTKDLYVAVRLIEALLKHRDAQTRYQPLQGFAEGLTLLRRLVEEAWERLYPSIDDGDLEVRAAPISWIDDADRANSLPNILRSTPLVADFWYFDFNPSARGESVTVDKAAEDRAKEARLAAGAAGPKHWQTIVEPVAMALGEIEKLDALLLERMGDDLAPSVRHLRRALNDLMEIAQGYAPRQSAPEEPASPSPQAGATAGPVAAASAPPPRTEALTRAEIYEQLSEAADKLQKIEPHSPIPYLINRAVELGQMPFPELMKALISDAKVIDDLNKGLGIKPDAPPAK
jgi:type VI secretion system protein ImpA